jgi:hypothetical protein
MTPAAGRGDDWTQLLDELARFERARWRLFWLTVAVLTACGVGGFWLE